MSFLKWSASELESLLISFLDETPLQLEREGIKERYDDERGEMGRLFEGGVFEEIRYLGHTTEIIRDLKMPRRRRQRERQKKQSVE